MAKFGTYLRKTATRFGGDTSGNIALVFGFTATALMMAVGFGVNIAQSYEVKTSLRDALDAAITSTARDITTGKIDKKDARASVERFFLANSDTRFVTTGTYALDALDVDDLTRTITGTAIANVDLAFPVFTKKNPRVAVRSAATYSDKQIEVAMMLDVTGSMKANRRIDKIGALKDAAENAVTSMLGNQDPKNPRVRVSIVPYSSGVNAAGLSRVLYGEKAGGSSLPPLATDGLFSKLLLGTNLPLFDLYTGIVSAAFPAAGNCSTERKLKDGAADLSADAPDTVRLDKNGKKYYALVNRDERLGACPQAQIIPLTTDAKSLIDSIKAFEADGSTAGAIAMQWTYYMLSPNWRSAIKDAGLGNGAANYDGKKISKVAIMMTDGQFNTAYSGTGDQGAASRGNAEAICDNMKSDGIQIYTIGFDLNDPGMKPIEKNQAKDLLKDCATPDKGGPRHYFEASTAEELNDAFSEIIRNQEIVAITQ